MVHMPERPKRTEVVYGITRSMLGKIAELPKSVTDSLPMGRLSEALLIASRYLGRTVGSSPCRNPKGSKVPALDPYWSSFTLIYSPALDDGGAASVRTPTTSELEHAARQLRAFGTRAAVVGNHVRIGRDLYSLWDARRLCVLCEAQVRPGENRKPADRRTFVKMLSAFARSL